ncbi:MAG: family 1 glycosylhydrolase [Candidatus Sericytochromatia bacterium]|nr:family 1 glycosylhydrolase [Candidatus Sericytochromatia bacterium]
MSSLRRSGRWGALLLVTGLPWLSACTAPSGLPDVVPMAGLPPSRPPERFLWGVAVAGHQVEGGAAPSQWREWEKAGRVPDRSRPHLGGWWRWREDLALAKRMGLTAYRFGVEWARVEPSPDAWDDRALARYAAMAREARRLGMRPIVTLMHFTYPAWLDQADFYGRRGWERRDAPERFARYAARVARALAPEDPLWLTLNEPTMMAYKGYVDGQFPPGERSPWKGLLVLGRLLQGHVLAREVLKQVHPGALVGFTHYMLAMHPFSVSPLEPGDIGKPLPKVPFGPLEPDLWLMGLLEPRALAEVDFLGLDAYTAVSLARPDPGPYARWPVVPHGLREAARRAWHHVGRKPLLFTENGMATEDGRPRKDGWSRSAHLVAHVRMVEELKRSGVPVWGYCHWTLYDNWEWGSRVPRFGLYAAEPGDHDGIRRPTAAVGTYARIVREGGVGTALVQDVLRQLKVP